MISKQFLPLKKSIYYSCFTIDDKHYFVYKNYTKCIYDNLFVLPIPSKYNLSQDNIINLHYKDFDKYLVKIQEVKEDKSKNIFKPVTDRIGKDTYNKPIPWTDIIFVNDVKNLNNYFSEDITNFLSKKYPDWKFVVGSVRKFVEPGLISLLYEPKFSTTLFYPCIEASEASPNLINSVENPDFLVDRSCSIIAGRQQELSDFLDYNPKILRLNNFTKNNDIWIKEENLLKEECIYHGL